MVIENIGNGSIHKVILKRFLLKKKKKKEKQKKTETPPSGQLTAKHTDSPNSGVACYVSCSEDPA